MNNDVRLIFNEFGFSQNQVLRDSINETILNMVFPTNYMSGQQYGVNSIVTFSYKMGNNYDITIRTDDFLLVTPRNSNQIAHFKEEIHRKSKVFSVKLLPENNNRMSYQCSMSNVREGQGQSIFNVMATTTLSDLKTLSKILYAGF